MFFNEINCGDTAGYPQDKIAERLGWASTRRLQVRSSRKGPLRFPAAVVPFAL